MNNSCMIPCKSIFLLSLIWDDKILVKTTPMNKSHEIDFPYFSMLSKSYFKIFIPTCNTYWEIAFKISSRRGVGGLNNSSQGIVFFYEINWMHLKQIQIPWNVNDEKKSTEIVCKRCFKTCRTHFMSNVKTSWDWTVPSSCRFKDCC